MGAENTPQTATTPAASGVDTEAISKAVTAALSAALPQAIAGALKPVAEQVAALSEAQKELASKSAAAPAIKPEDLAKAISEQLAAAQTAQQKAQTDAKARTDAIAGRLKGVPAVYAEKLGQDPAKWDDEAKAIRETYQADLTAAGVKAPPVTSAAGTPGATNPGAVETSKLKGMQLIKLAVEQSQPIPASASVVSQTADAAATTAAAAPADK